MKHTKKQTIKRSVAIACVLLACVAIYGLFCVYKNRGEGVLSDGSYEANVQLEGGSGKASVTSPTVVSVEDGNMSVLLEWSSSHYDYMIVDGEKYLPVNKEGNSCFEIKFQKLNEPFEAIADTTAMSKPHEITYSITVSLVKDSQEESNKKESAEAVENSDEVAEVQFEIPKQIENLEWFDSLKLDYATEFSVDFYKEKNSEDIYSLITINQDGQFLIGPEKPSSIYLVASPAMDMFVALDAMDKIRFSAKEKDGWSQEKAQNAMESGDIVYAGKYSTPDYELILEKGCDFAIENTMIYHTPEVKEKLESFGITVMIDRSSYERHPLGRMEWIKLYGVLTGKEEEAITAFEEQCKVCQNVMNQVEKQEKRPTVAFFYLSPNGEVKVRRTNDYLPKMIEMAGGTYIFDDLGDEEDSSSTITLQMEEFYAKAKDVDYMIYNSTIVGELESLDDLLAKNPLLKDMKAVKEGHVYCTEEDLYQSSMSLGTIIEDMHKMLTGEEDMKYLYPLR